MSKKWNYKKAEKIFFMPLIDLIYKAHKIHRKNFDPNSIQTSELLSIKTGNCPENCSYCSQSVHNKSQTEKEPLMNVTQVIEKAKQAKKNGNTRFCMGAAWRSPKSKDLNIVCDMVKAVKEIGLETCVTLGMLGDEQAKQLKEAGLDYYNHNIDTSPEFYSKIITTRTFDDRIKTLEACRKAGIKLCSGGIIGLGETNIDRIKMLVVLANLEVPPESVPINKLVKIPGTKLEQEKEIEFFDFVRTIALARIMMPKSYVRLSAGRESMSEAEQFVCFMAGANSVFSGEKLLTTGNIAISKDTEFFKKVGIAKIVL